MQELNLRTLKDNEWVQNPEFKVAAHMKLDGGLCSNVRIQPMIARETSSLYEFQVLARHYNIQLLPSGMVSVSYLGGPLYQLAVYRTIINELNKLGKIQYHLKADIDILYTYKATIQSRCGKKYSHDKSFQIRGRFSDGDIRLDRYKENNGPWTPFNVMPMATKRLILDAERIATTKINRIYEACDFKDAADLLQIPDAFANHRSFADKIRAKFNEPCPTVRMTHAIYEALFQSGFMDVIAQNYILA